MPVTQQQAIFTTEEAERFAALWAGFDLGNQNEAEAMGKGRAVRRMMAAKGVRLVDAFELPEICAALDIQMQPAHAPVPDVVAMEAELEDLRGKLADVVPEVTRLAEALTRETELSARLKARLQGRTQQNRSIAGPFLSGVLALALAVECVVAVIGLFGGHENAKGPEPLTAAMVLAPFKPEAEHTKPSPKAVPVPEVLPEVQEVVPEVPESVPVPASRQPFHWQQLWKAFEAKEDQGKRRDQGKPVVRVVPESKF